jgi:hypothetical protein
MTKVVGVFVRFRAPLHTVSAAALILRGGGRKHVLLYSRVKLVMLVIHHQLRWGVKKGGSVFNLSP